MTNKKEHVIVIVEQGWIFEGNMNENYELSEAHIVRRWTNGRGIGGLQKEAYKDEYILDDLPSGIRINPDKVLATLPISEW